METDITTPMCEITRQILVVLCSGGPYQATLQCIENVRHDNTLTDMLKIEYNIAGLCQYPKYEIRRVEPITIWVQDGQLPIVEAREDFPIVPHLVVNRDGMKTLCYTDFSYSEIKHRLNGQFIVECINEWFVRTARDELHRDDQPLEPFFFGVQDMIVVKKQFFHNYCAKFKEIQQNNRLTLQQVPDGVNGTGVYLYVVIRLNIPPSKDNIIHHPPKSLGDLFALFSSKHIEQQLMTELWEILKIRLNKKNFQSTFVNMSFLFCLPCIIFLHIPQRRKKTSIIETSDNRVFITNGHRFGDILNDFGIHRQIIVGEKKSQEYKLTSTGKNYHGENISISQLNLHFETTPPLARIYSGINEGYQHKYFVLIGAGALGSQVYVNCLRSGFGKWAIIDFDVFLPHNLTRHVLSQSSVGQPKATELVQYANSVIENPEVCAYVADVLDHHSADILMTLATADVIVDVSTSVAVERMLAIDTKTKARCISLFLNPRGDCLVMLCEDSERTITLDQLEMQLNAILINETDLENFYCLPTTIAYATSCRDITTTIPQENIALTGAVASKELKLAQENMSSNIVVWKISNDGIAAQRYAGERWHEISCGDWRVLMRYSLLHSLQEKRIERQPNETGGVLIGNYDFSRKIIYVVDMIFSPSDSIEVPSSYIRGCKNLPEQINQISKRTFNGLFYIGEWHSHPSQSTAMSCADEKLLRTISDVCKANCLLGAMIICGSNSNLSFYLRDDTMVFSETFIFDNTGQR